MIGELVLKSKVSRSAVIKSKAVGGDGVTGGRDRPEKEGGLEVESWIRHISNIIEFQILNCQITIGQNNKDFIHVETEFIELSCFKLIKIIHFCTTQPRYDKHFTLFKKKNSYWLFD